MISLVFCACVNAEDIDDVVVGVYYYKKGFFSDGKVKVIDIDKYRSRVKVFDLQSEEIDWISASSLITRSDSIERDVDRVITTLKIIDKLFSDTNNSSNQNLNPTNWVPDTKHNLYKNVVASTERGKWRPANGYDWVEMDKSWDVKWVPGVKHQNYQNVISSNNEGNWIPNYGYDWDNKESSWFVHWSPGKKHPLYSHVVAGNTKDKWTTEKGYLWIDPNRSWETAWYPGVKYSLEKPNIVSSDDEGYWIPAPGYIWKDRKIFLVEWKAGLNYTGNNKLVSTGVRDVWMFNGGVGVTLQINEDYPVIVKIHDGSPAKEAGLNEGDI